MRPPCARTSPCAITLAEHGAVGAAGRFAAPEAVEHPLLGAGCKACAAVVDGNEHLPALAADDHGDRPVRRRVSQRIGKQVEEDALDLVGGAAHRRGGRSEIGFESDAPRARLGLEPAQAGAGDGGERRLLEVERDGTGIDARQLEQVVHDRREETHLAV